LTPVCVNACDCKGGSCWDCRLADGFSLGATDAPLAERGAAAPAGGAPAAPLGNNADFASNALPDRPAIVSPGTVKAWYLRSSGRELLKREGINKRLRWCGSRISRGSQGVSVFSRPDRAYGRLSGVCVCGQSICCPVCAPRIAAFRSAEVAEGFERAKSRGYDARLATFTFPHASGSSLGDEIDAFAKAWRVFGSGCMAAKRRKNSLGNIVGREVTHGLNGWHYHYHVLRFDRTGTFEEELHRAGWLAALETIGRRTDAATLRAYHVGEIGDRARAAYCAKLSTAVEAQARAIGSEIASAATKGRNLASLLLAASTGDVQAGKTWVAGVSEIVKRKVSSVRWSRGLRAELGLQVEKDDEQIAQDEVLETDVYLGELTPMQWRGVLLHRAEFCLLVAAQNGLDAVNSFLRGLDLGELDAEAAPAVDLSTNLDGIISRRVLDDKDFLAVDIARFNREQSRPSGLTRAQIEGMKE